MAAVGKIARDDRKKLKPIAMAVKEMLEAEFGIPARYEIEKRDLDWLRTIPDQNLLSPVWEDISNAYRMLLDGKCELSDRLALCSAKSAASRQRADVWFESPYSFILEFDEKQHFNQFRLMTLEVYNKYRDVGFDPSRYEIECRRRTVKPGKSGFARLREEDPLFPELYEGEKQDNRYRQRAFRDLLKDLMPLTRRDVNPTWRAGIFLTGGKHKDFSEEHCSKLCEYFKDIGALKTLREAMEGCQDL